MYPAQFALWAVLFAAASDLDRTLAVPFSALFATAVSARAAALDPSRWSNGYVSTSPIGDRESSRHGGETGQNERDRRLAAWGTSIGGVDIPSGMGSSGASSTSAGQSAGGWLARWLSIGGEGDVVVTLGDHNATFPHRPAAFPQVFGRNVSLPLQGFLTPFHLLPPLRSTLDEAAEDESEPSGLQRIHVPVSPPSTPPGRPHGKQPTHEALHPDIACISPAWPPIRYTTPSRPYKIALVERGGCEFAVKVRAAQERGAAGVIVGDGELRVGEPEEEGRNREGLITMFSPDDTEGIYIPSVFVSRASWFVFKDMLENGTDSGHPEGPGLWIELGEGKDDGNTLSSLLSFALLLPSMFLLSSIAIHRFRMAREREANRAPPTVVLSLPERIWTPDIVWEKDEEEEGEEGDGEEAVEGDVPDPRPGGTGGIELSPDDGGETSPSKLSRNPSTRSTMSAHGRIERSEPSVAPARPSTSRTRSQDLLMSAATGEGAPPSKRSKPRTKSAVSAKKYFSKDECAICMDNFRRGDVVRILPCGHVFHKVECDEWLLKWRKLCPTCRADVTVPAGGTPVQGTTLSQVGPLLQPGRDEENQAGGAEPVQSALTSFRSRLRVIRSRLFARRGARDTESAGAASETTPLVAGERQSGV